MNEIDDLKCFLDVVESGGFNRAAERMGVSKSVVSRRIARMEAELGTRLLTRTPRGVHLTDAGQELKGRAERLLSEFAEAREAVSRHGAELVGRLRLSVPLSYGLDHVAPVLSELAARHPQLELDIDFSDRITDLVGEGFDAAIRIGNLPDSSLIARRIAPARGLVVASQTYLDRHGAPATPDDLQQHECLIYTGARSTDWPFMDGERTVRIRPRGRMRSDSGDVLLRWAEDGLGIAFLPTFLVSRSIEAGRVVPVLMDYPSPEYAIHVLRPPGNHVPNKVRVFTELMVERLGDRSGWDGCMTALTARDND